MGNMIGIRTELVARFKREIKDKTYKVKSEEIAQKMAQALKEEEKFVSASTPQKNRWV